MSSLIESYNITYHKLQKILFFLFLGCLLIGGYSIFFSESMITPIFMVIIYGSTTAYFCKKYKFSEQDLFDSPYLLGFIFTLVSIFGIFFEVKSDNSNENIISSAVALRNGGIAISTTVIGLIFRFFLIFTDSSNARTFDTLKVLKRELENGISAYSNAQINLIKL